MKNMASRRMVGEILIASPLIMLLGIAVQARTSSPQFEPYAYNAEQNDALRAMRPLLCETKSAVQSKKPIRLRRAAENWIQGFEAGSIAPFRRANYFDSARSGIKGEISVAIDKLAFKLGNIAFASMESGNYDEGLQDLELAVGAIRHFKYADLDSIGFFAMRERMCLQVSKPFIDSMNPNQLKRLSTILDQINVSEESILRGAATADRYYAIDGLRWNQARSKILDPFARSQVVSNGARRSVNQFSIASLSRPLFDQANSIRYAKASLDTQRKSIKALRDKISASLERKRH